MFSWSSLRYLCIASLRSLNIFLIASLKSLSCASARLYFSEPILVELRHRVLSMKEKFKSLYLRNREGCRWRQSYVKCWKLSSLFNVLSLTVAFRLVFLSQYLGMGMKGACALHRHPPTVRIPLLPGTSPNNSLHPSRGLWLSVRGQPSFFLQVCCANLQWQETLRDYNF